MKNVRKNLSCTNWQEFIWVERSAAIVFCLNSLGFLCASFWIRLIYFATCVGILSGPINHRYSLNSMSGDYPLKFKSIFFMTLIRELVGVWDKRYLGIGAVGHLGIGVRTPWWALLVGYTPALAPLWRHLTPMLERELGRVAEGRLRRYWDRSNIPQRKRRMKCGIMGNWRCISDSARCPCLRSHWVNCLAPSCWMRMCCMQVGSWQWTVLCEYPSVIIVRMAFARN